MFKKSIDKVFDRVSAFTWEKYKEDNDDDEEKYRELLFKKSIDKVFDRVSAFTWEKYKEENDDEENNDEENYQEFE